jgi:carboxyl-terminal processing protease
MRVTNFRFTALLLMTAFAGLTVSLNVSYAFSTTTQDEKLYRMLDLFGEIVEQVHSKYVDKPDDDVLIQSALTGMLSSLDPHSSYLSAKEYSEMQVQSRGEFGGIGLEISIEDGVLKVVSPLDDSPAAKAGLRANDVITRVDNEPMSGLTQEQAVEKMRGPVDSPVTLTILRKDVERPFDVKVIRELIRIDPVKELAEGNVAYIKITSFNEQTHARLVKAVKRAKGTIGAKLKGYIIDLRNNPGGLLEQAILVADDFLDDGTIVITKGRNPEDSQRANARPGDLADGRKLVVLINGGSASASEIVAGALQDHKRATVIGTRSFGKGSVQTIIPLGFNGAIRLTTARYYTPSNRSIQARGIEPDITIEEKMPDKLKKFASAAERWEGEASLHGHLKNPTEDTRDGNMKESSGSSAYVPADQDKDTQLQYALALLRGTATEAKIANGPASQSTESDRGMPQ